MGETRVAEKFHKSSKQNKGKEKRQKCVFNCTNGIPCCTNALDTGCYVAVLFVSAPVQAEAERLFVCLLLLRKAN